MHSLYLEMHANSVHSPVSESYYRLVFNTEYNLAFHRPMKDQCDLCKSFQNSINDEKAKLQEEYDSHISNKLLSRASKDSDKLKAKSDFVAACFDLEEVLLTPHSFESVLYCKRRLNTFNFTLYNMGTKDGYCHVWNETMACQSASEIASCVLHFIKTMSESGKKSFVFYSDNCGGQNNNRVYATMLWYALNKFNLSSISISALKKVTLTIHSAIETNSRFVSVFTTPQWAATMRAARPRHPYIVK